jgi:hypothetical protein
LIDFGEALPPELATMLITDDNGALINVTTVVATITLPDGTTATPAVTNPTTGTYKIAYTPTQSGRHTIRWVGTGTSTATLTLPVVFTDEFDVDEAAPSGIVSLAEAKAHLNMTSTTNDEELRRYIDAATDFIESRIGYVVRRTVVETVYPSGGVLFLTGPVISLTTMVAAYGYSGVYSVANYSIAPGSAVLPNYGSSSLYYGPVTVTYVAGRAVVPALIRQAALDYIAWKWETQRGATPAPGMGGEFEVTTPATVPFKILQALEPYALAVVA